MNLNLTLRQKQCLFLAAKGNNRKQIGKLIHIAPSSVVVHLKSVYDKFGLEGQGSEIQAILLAIKNNIFSLEDVFDKTHDFLTGTYGQVKGAKHTWLNN
jgi:DNA-binding CsgD family transcriptional regulator